MEPLYEKYEHHGKEVVVKTEFKGKHRDICLCYDCPEFKDGAPVEEGGCEIAKAVYKSCVEFGIVSPVLECPKSTIL